MTDRSILHGALRTYNRRNCIPGVILGSNSAEKQGAYQGVGGEGGSPWARSADRNPIGPKRDRAFSRFDV